MDSLLQEFQSGPVKAVGYADDIIIMASGIDMRINTENIQLALNKRKGIGVYILAKPSQ